MNRRDFLKNCLAAGVGIGMAGLPFASATRLGSAMAGEAAGGDARPPEIVAVRGGEPDAMFDRGMAAMGGMGRFVKKGQTVAIKTNASWDVPVELAGNTNPALLKRLVQHCLEAGASRVLLFDHAIEPWRRCYESSGLNIVARDTGAVIAPADSEGRYQDLQVGGRALNRAKVHEAMLEADVLISAPILKHHGGAGMTGGIKNFMGAVWDRGFYHRNDLAQCIADFLLVRKPDLTVLDAYRVLAGNGPRSRSEQDVRLMKMQVISTDVLAADASGARLLGKQPEDYGHLRAAHALGMGEIDPSRLPSRRISLA